MNDDFVQSAYIARGVTRLSDFGRRWHLTRFDHGKLMSLGLISARLILFFQIEKPGAWVCSAIQGIMPADWGDNSFTTHELYFDLK